MSNVPVEYPVSSENLEDRIQLKKLVEQNDGIPPSGWVSYTEETWVHVPEVADRLNRAFGGNIIRAYLVDKAITYGDDCFSAAGVDEIHGFTHSVELECRDILIINKEGIISTISASGFGGVYSD